uniref:Uncharacterized protein n=1 Tax=Moniliophthora roreri TaxID=221103 RepID=A0A0W0FTJ4_MONRR
MAKFLLNASTIFAPVQIKPFMVSSQLDEIAKLGRKSSKKQL